MAAAVRTAALFLLIAAWAGNGAHAGEKRVALVIGNAAYTSTAALHNTLNDADMMSKALKDVGFEVVDGRNLDKAGSDRALARFAGVMQGADVTLFYFAGHGLQINGQNYLLPVDAQSQDELSLPFESIKLNDVIGLLGQNGGVRIMVLDACRNNPFSAFLAQKSGSRSVGGVTRGLARVERTQGMLVAYATQANEVAEDGAGGNSPFTQELVSAIREPGVRVGDVFQNVVMRVHQRTGGRQTPEVSFSLVGEFYFNHAETDLDAWKKAATSKDAQQLQAFITRFPTSSLVDSARALIDALETSGAREKAAEQLRLQKHKLEQLQAQLDQAQASERQKEAELAARTRAEQPHERDRLSSERDRLAAELEGKRRRTAAIETEKAQLESERSRLEQALAGRLAEAPSPRETVGKGYSAPQPVSSPPMQSRSKPGERSCSEILSRIQLGEMTAADVDALKKCR
jgi:uncharacterized caspase-like protein